MPLDFQNLGRMPFAEALAYQKELRRRRQAGEIGDTVLFTEHPRVITRGRRPADEDFRVAPAELLERGFSIEDAGRGGKLTYHGPGQLVAYFIVSLRERRLGIPDFVRRIEAAVVETLVQFGVRAQGDPEFPGVWVEGRKIASIGLAVDRGVSMNGIALNVAPDLDDFEVIIPCGIPDCRMTSLSRETGRSYSIPEVRARLQVCLERAFDSKAGKLG
ncbi:MAG: lipoyl(octanoyl) transferase LipB [bacterium]